ncbi:MAG TPA: efflux RND transporter periplasmic adaptor subunit [Caulobacteraceae bacterium]|nr:efflux RND transporter periplasmic adaptor subunit [Caulobacteraceae bacterium]
MSRNQLIAAAAILIVIVGAGALVLTHRGGGDDSDQGEPTATATITTAPIRSGVLEDVTTVFGVVQADPGASRTLAAPRAVIVEQVLARPGQVVSAGEPLAVIESQPAADLAYKQAADAATSARNDLARVQRLFDSHLAASDQLIQAKKTAADADSALAAQQRQGAGRQTLTADAPAVVVSVSAAPGDHIAQDAAIMVLARQGALSVKLGIEPSVGAVVAAGNAVTIRPTVGGAPIASRLTMVGRAIDPTTHLAPAIAPLSGAALPVGAAVQADVATGAHQGLAVPRGAVVFDETGAHVFVVAGGKAQRVFVTAGRDHGDEIEISGPIKAGQLVAVEGAYELQDGMAVKVAGPRGSGPQGSAPRGDDR